MMNGYDSALLEMEPMSRFKARIVVMASVALTLLPSGFELIQAGEVPVNSFGRVITPTARDRLDPTIPGTFQPTSAGNPESALFGSVRTTQIGKHLYPQFHEGVDIAPLQRNAHGMPLDEVRSVAAGTVGYVNQLPGNSNYGNYVVLLHDDPMGQVYTLYAHLAVVSPELRVGKKMETGTVLGIMGHTPAGIVPASRAHLHFEVGVVANARFGEWFRAQHLKPDHGMFNGLNLLGINPLDFFKARDSEGHVEFRRFIATIPIAFELLIPATKPLDYFRRYPSLWQGAPQTGRWAVITCSEDGVILAGRSPNPDELRLTGSGKTAVLKADTQVLGRNGCRLVVCDDSRWRLGEKGARWLEILCY